MTWQIFAPELVISPTNPMSEFAHRIACQKDLAYLMQHSLGIDIAWFHREWIDMVKKHVSVWIACSRRHIKSTFTQALAIQYSVQEHPKRILVVMNSLPQTKNWAREFKDKLDYYIEQAKSEVTIVAANTEEIRLSNGSIIYIRSLTGKIRGLSPHLIICDDLLDEKQNLSFVEAEEIFRRVILGTRITRNGRTETQTVYVGTILREGDILDNMRQGEYGGFCGKEYPAILDWEKKMVLWPEKYPWNLLMEWRRDVGEYAFQVEYLLNPLSDELAMIPRKLMDICKDPTRSIHDKTDGVAVMGVDLAISAATTADYSVYLTLVLEGNQIILQHMERLHGARYDYQLQRIKQLWHKYNHQLILVESNQFQQVIAQQLRDIAATMPIQETVTGRNKNDMEVGVPSLRQLFENQKIVIPWKDTESRDLFQILIAETAGWQYDKTKGKFVSRTKHDDTTMALWIAIQAVRQIEGGRARFTSIELDELW